MNSDTFSEIFKVIAVIFSVITPLVLIWVAIYKFYIWLCKAMYSRDFIDLKNIKLDAPEERRYLKIYFLRYQSYEISAYLILGLSALLLGLCTYFFIYATTIIKIDYSDEKFRFYTGLSIRLVIGLIAFFLTRVLLKLYSFCLKASLFYMSRFDYLLYNKKGLSKPHSELPLDFFVPGDAMMSSFLPKTEAGMIEIAKLMKDAK